MPKNRTQLEKEIGQLISKIQKIWIDQVGEPECELSEQVMYRAHDLYQKKIQQYIISEQYTVIDFLGQEWLSHHKELFALVKKIELLIKENKPIEI